MSITDNLQTVMYKNSYLNIYHNVFFSDETKLNKNDVQVFFESLRYKEQNTNTVIGTFPLLDKVTVFNLASAQLV